MLAVALGLIVTAVLLWPLPEAEAPGIGGITGSGPSGAGRPSSARQHPADPGTEHREEDGDEGADGGVGDGQPSGVVTVDDAADALVLASLALRAGLAPVEALEAVAHEVEPVVARPLRVVASAHRWGQDAATAWTHVGDTWRPAALAWQAAERSGAAPAAVVLAAAERMRCQEAARVEAAVQRAGVLLVLPLGACFLPGFVATTVVPVLLHLARSSLGGPP